MKDYVALVFTDLVNSTAVKDTMPGDTITKRNQAYRDNILFPHRKRVTESLINYGGRVVEPPQGDGYLLEFDDPVQAIEWAVFIQRSHENEPISTPSGPLKVKIGIHYGAPLRDGDRFIGQEVDYADRVAALAKGGQILLTKTMAVLIEAAKVQDIKIDFFGEYELKGIGTVPISEIVYNEFKNSEREIKKSPYVERPPIEKNCYQKLLNEGALIRIKAPKKMGKTWLVSQVFESLSSQGYRTARLSMEEIDREDLIALETLLSCFCREISRELNLTSQVEEYWEEEKRGNKSKCTSYFQDYLLPDKKSPLVLAIDDVDWLFQYPSICAEFCSMLRNWHERSKTNQIWKQLRLIVVLSTEEYIKLPDNQSPFNVGTEIKLTEFTLGQIQAFAQYYGLEENTIQLSRWINLVGGHPYLLSLIFSHLNMYPDVNVTDLFAVASTEQGIYSSYLREFLEMLKRNSDLRKAFKSVVNSTEAVTLEASAGYKLQSMGLIKWRGNQALPSCQLYREYFSDRL
jgi:hypothetical protein